MSRPFLSFYTPTYRRPEGLARCIASVRGQTIASEIEQVIIADHVGIGVHGMFAAIPQYASALHGEYVHLLCDDDMLAGPSAVESVRAAARADGNPELLLVQASKGGLRLPIDPNPWPPVMGRIDLSCFIVRHDVWQRHAADYGHRYEGDFDFADALYRAGVVAHVLQDLFVIGGVSRGAAEAAA